MGNITDYTIAQASTSTELIIRVNKLIDSGRWQPEGGHVVIAVKGTSVAYQQTLVKRNIDPL